MNQDHTSCPLKLINIKPIGIKKPLKEYPKLYSKKKDGTPISDGRRANCRVCENARRKKCYQKDIRSRLWMNAKQRAKRDGLLLDIEKEDIIIPPKCPILNVKFIILNRQSYRLVIQIHPFF